MMDVISQQGWSELSDVTTLTLTEVSDLPLFKDDGAYWAKPLVHLLRKLKCFLLLYLQNCQDLSSNHDKDSVLSMSKMEINDYSGSPE
jgi:hypothetical protein